MQLLQQCFPLNIPPTEKPHLLVIIDTEEEFDWSNGFSRGNTSVRHMRSIGKIQKIFERWQIVPVYAVNYPISSQEEGVSLLKEYRSSDRCIIGAHMHPWVTPPFEERVCARNSFQGNLPPSLEAKKLKILCNCIEDSFGIRPTIHKAGRYGLGANTMNILKEKSFEFDVSVCPHMNFSPEGGPDYSEYSSSPYWVDKDKTLLELPLTVGFEGGIRHWGSRLYPKLARESIRRVHIPGILSRMGLLNRVVLSPENSTLHELIRLVRALIKDGLRVFSLGLHSPSVEPGNTPYVRSSKELDDFLTRLDQFFDFFFGEIQGQPSTPGKVKKAAQFSHHAGCEEVQ